MDNLRTRFFQWPTALYAGSDRGMWTESVFSAWLKPSYNRMSEDENESSEQLLENQEKSPRERSNRWQSISINNLLLVLLHSIIATIWISVSVLPEAITQSQLSLPHEIPWASDIIEYQTVKFTTAGTRDKPNSAFEGLPTSDKDLLWWNLMNVGNIALTPEQNKSLNFPGLMPVSDSDGRPFVEISMFHQLHCLNWIRHVVYDPQKYGVYYSQAEKVQKEVHIDHCIDYLRQVIMCHGDLTPIPHVPRIGNYNHDFLVGYKSDFEIVNSCRNFDKIYEWASTKNVTSRAGEKHPNIDPWREFQLAVAKQRGVALESMEALGWLGMESKAKWKTNHP